MKQIKNCLVVFIISLTFNLNVFSQTCGVAQSLTPLQQTQINTIVSPLDTALKYENLFLIDSLSNELKIIYASQGGYPDAIESYTNLVSTNNWLDLNEAISLSRLLIAADSLMYVDLWKAALGQKPPLYQPNSLFLRASAEIAVGLLKIADKETDLSRKALYQSWATKALDSLATMQIQSGPCAGAFPFPDLRTYGDPVFSPIIQNFMLFCGSDSVNVLQGGWIVDDKGTGEFKFDAGVIANAFYEAYLYTGNLSYKTVALAVGEYLMPLKFNRNYNYNTFVSLGLTRAFQLTNDSVYLNRAIANLRYSVFPGQLSNGRWVDGHNANSRYHSIIIQNIIPTILEIPSSDTYQYDLNSMTYKAIKNMLDYTITCNAATGYRWLIKAYGLPESIIPSTLKDSIADLIGQHINQSANNGNFLDIPTMGEYIELLDLLAGTNEFSIAKVSPISVFPNPTSGTTTIHVTFSTSENIELSLVDINGRQLKTIDKGQKTKGTYSYTLDVSLYQNGVYFLNLQTSTQKNVLKIFKTE